MKKISIKGVLFAIVAMAVLDLINGILLMAFLPDSFPTNLPGKIKTNYEFNFLIWSLFLGNATTLVGGYVAAKFSAEAPFKNAFIFGVFGVLLGILLASILMPFWFQAITFVTTIPFALLGAYIHTKIKD